MTLFLENKWYVSLSAGVLLGLSFPPINLSFLTIPAFVLLIYLVNSCVSNRQLIAYSYLGFVVWNVITTYWLLMASIGAGAAAILANSLLMTLPLLLMRFFQQKYSSPIIVVILQAAAWTSYEFLHHHWDLSWPWLAIGNAWANQISLIQFISITGHLGITFWVVITAALAYQALVYKQKMVAIAALVIFLGIPLASLIYFGINKPVPASPETVHITVAQPNHDSYEPYGGMRSNREVLDSLFAVTTSVLDSNTDLIVWPENALDRALYLDSYEINRIADSARAWQTNFIVGTGLVTLYEDNVPSLTYGTNQDGLPYNIFNSALFVDEAGSLSRYDKNHLVPFVERFAFVNFFSKLDVFEWFNWGRLAGYGRGSSPSMLQTPKFSTPGLVCYDSVYPGWAREFVNQGAGFITIITNDGWWGNSSGHKQHFAYAKLRAIEFNRWVVRSANNGTSGIIRPDGTVEQATKYWVRTGFTTTIPVLKKQTIYARYGDWLAFQCLGLVLTFWVLGILYPNSFSTLIE